MQETKRVVEKDVPLKKDDLIVIGPDHDRSFNFLEYERTRQGRGSGLTECIVSLFDELEAVKDPGAGKAGGDPFFRAAARDLARQVPCNY